DVVVLDAARGGDGDVLGLDEGGEGPGEAQAAAGELLLGEEDAVDQAVGVEVKEGAGEELAVDRPALHDAEGALQPLEEGAVRGLEDVGAVEPVGLDDRAGEELAVLLDADVGEAAEGSDEVLGAVVPA